MERRGTAEDNGFQTWISREIAGGRAVVADLDPVTASEILTDLTPLTFRTPL
nr:hypothetical protein GCM10010200_049250 [Actinomadura rugatobispora]